MIEHISNIKATSSQSECKIKFIFKIVFNKIYTNNIILLCYTESLTKEVVLSTKFTAVSTVDALINDSTSRI